MGRKTFESIGKPLPKRRNIVLTRSHHNGIEGVEVYHSIEELLEQLEKGNADEEVFIIGGEAIYKQFLQHADYIYLTEIKKRVEGDTHFPPFKAYFEEMSRESHEEFDFVLYQNKDHHAEILESLE